MFRLSRNLSREFSTVWCFDTVDEDQPDWLAAQRAQRKIVLPFSEKFICKGRKTQRLVIDLHHHHAASKN